LPFLGFRAIHVIAETPQKGENTMITNAEATETALAPEAEQPKATKKASAGKRGAHVAPAKGKSGKKASPAKKATSAKKAAKAEKKPWAPAREAKPARSWTC
jgi:hypothetical protein